MSALKPEDEMFLAQVAEAALALELTTVSGVIEGEDDDGNPAFVAIVVGVEVYDTLEDATAAVQLDDSEAVPANVTLQ
tara:strand:- start:43857 stop:44090 length:234 start_codon:yes stop_codon:yes gene_type:complete